MYFTHFDNDIIQLNNLLTLSRLDFTKLTWYVFNISMQIFLMVVFDDYLSSLKLPNYNIIYTWSTGNTKLWTTELQTNRNAGQHSSTFILSKHQQSSISLKEVVVSNCSGVWSFTVSYGGKKLPWFWIPLSVWPWIINWIKWPKMKRLQVRFPHGVFCATEGLGRSPNHDVNGTKLALGSYWRTTSNLGPTLIGV